VGLVRVFLQVGGLAPYTSYTFRVQAVNTAGGGEWSDHTTLCTAAAAPAAPAAPTVLATTSNTVSLKWAAPENTFGSPVVSYTLEAATGDPSNKKLVRTHSLGSAHHTHSCVEPIRCSRIASLCVAPACDSSEYRNCIQRRGNNLRQGSTACPFEAAEV
jgi:hypothetical protein